MNTRALPSYHPGRIRSAGVLLVDVDGVLTKGGQAAAGAVPFVEAFGDRMILVSNNSTHTPESLSSHLKKMRLVIPAERIRLAGCLAVDVIAERHPGSRPFILAAPPLLDYARCRGLETAGENEPAQIMLVARDTGLNYDRLNHALNLLLRGARVYAANPDLYHPAENGRVNLETGLLLAVLKAARPNSEVHLIGKPSPMLIEKALRDAGMGAAEALFIGDNPLTDGGAAAAADVPMALIGPSPGAVAGDLNQLLHLEGL